jgi:hypothetical protein
MRRFIAAAIAVIALALPSVGCKVLGTATRDASEAATRARGATDELNQIRKGACNNVKMREYSRAAQGDYSGDDTPIC